MSQLPSGPLTRTDRRRRRRKAQLVRWGARLAVVAVVFAVGVAVGEALHDNPRPGHPVTNIRTLPPPGPQTVTSG